MPVYRPWTYANRQDVRSRASRDFRNNATVYDEEQTAAREPAAVNPIDQVRSGPASPPLAEARKKGGGGGFLGGLKELAGDVGGAALGAGKYVGGKTLEALDKPAEYTLRPVMGILSGQTEVDRQPILDAGGNPTGQFYRSGSSGGLGSDLRKVGKSLKDLATQNPLDTYREGKQAFEETMADPGMGAGQRAFMSAGSDPLTYIGPGAMKAGLKFLPAATKASKAFRVAAGVVEAPAAASVGGILGSSAAAEAASRADWSPGWQTAATLAGGLVGGVAGGTRAVPRALKGEGPLRGMGGSVIDANHPNLESYLKTLEDHGIEYRYSKNGAVEVVDPENTALRIEQIEDPALKEIFGTRTPGGSGATSDGSHYGSTERSDAQNDRRVAREEGKRGGTKRKETVPEVSPWAIKTMDDAERIREVMDEGSVDPALEAARSPFALGSKLANHVALAPEERGMLEEAIGNRTKGNVKRANEAATILGEDDAVEFVNDLLVGDMNPRGIRVAATSEIEQRGFEIGRTQLSLREKAYRAKLEAIAEEVSTTGHDATKVSDPQGAAAGRAGERDLGAGPEQPVAEGVGSTQGAGEQTVKRVGLDGTVTDTFQTEAELAGIRATQGGMDLGGETAAKRAALETAPTPEVRPPATAESVTTETLPTGGTRVAGEVPVSDVVRPDVPIDGLTPTQRMMQEPVKRRETGGIGSTPGQGNMLPPREPGQPGTPSGAPQAPLGQDGPGVDLIGGQARDSLVAKEQGYLGSKTGKVEQGIRKTLSRLGFGKIAPNLIRDPKFTPVWEEMNRITNLRSSFKAVVEQMWTRVEKAGLELERQPDGNWHVKGTGQSLGDVVEQTTPQSKAVWEGLSPEVKETLTDMTTLMDEARQTVERHGGDMPLIDVEGSYWSRKVTAIGGQEKTTGQVGSRRLGAKQEFQKGRTQAEMANATGVTYAHPLDSFQAGLDAKLRVAQDAYTKNLLKPLVDPAAIPGFGGSEDIPGVGVMTGENVTRATAGLASRTGGTIEKVLTGVNQVLTPIRASFDASGLFQQGMRRWLTDPKGAARDWKVTVKSLKDPAVYAEHLAEYDKAGPGLKYWAQRGLRLTAEGAANEVTHLAENAPTGTTRATGAIKGKFDAGLRVSSELYDRPLNLHRVAQANGLWARAKAAGLEGAALDAEMAKGAKAVNRMYGWTGTKPSSIESVALFAPRYFRANVETILKAVTDNGLEGAEARKHLALLAGEGAGLVVAINLARGYETEFDPRDGNFMRIRNVAGLDVSPFGGFDILVRAIAGTLGGDAKGKPEPDIARLGRLAWGKASPALKLVIEPLKGETYMGKPLDPLGNPAGFVWEQFKSSVPFGVQNLIEGAEAGDPSMAAKSWAVGSLGVSQQPVSPAENRDFERAKVAKARFGGDYDGLTGAQKAQVNEDSKVAGYQKDSDTRAGVSPGDYAKSTDIRVTVAKELDASAGYLAAGKDDAGKAFSGNDFRKAYNSTMTRAAGARTQIAEFSGGDKNVTAWFKLYDQATMPNGQVDFDKLERLQGDFRAANPGIDEKVDKSVGVRDNAAVRELREAKKLSRAYYQLPAYRGMSLEDAEKAGQITAIANDLVQFGKARDRDSAFRALRSFDAEGVRLAQIAARRGSNPERKAFRRDPANALFEKYYSDTSAVGV